MESDLEKIKHILVKFYEPINEVNVLLDIVFPILLCFKSNGKQYLCYVTLFSRRKNQVNMLVVEVTDDNVFKLINGNMSIRQAFIGDVVYQISNNHDLAYETSKGELNSLLPNDSFFLSESIPNKIDLTSIHMSK